MTVRVRPSVILPALIFFCCLSVSAQAVRPEQASSSKEAQSAPGETETIPGEAKTAPEENTDFILLQNRSGGITITGYRGTERSVIIPESFGGLPVTIIGSKAFYHRELSSVTIPKTVTTIEPMAFADNQLASVEVPGAVIIGYEAFANNRLTQLSLSADLVSIGQRAFVNNRLSTVAIPGRVSNIGKDAFADNPLRSITLGLSRNIFVSQGFEPSFVNYYNSTGRKAGVYVKDDAVWRLQKGDGE
ncbi:MAG: leucine-rich repeat domain-containing protein [Spirochaetaceae bacterium]|jgi:hypothetical protein|nr:leucine-rich repeat domain-containing protein [Spirochaetaceae bacterium]